MHSAGGGARVVRVVSRPAGCVVVTAGGVGRPAVRVRHGGGGGGGGGGCHRGCGCHPRPVVCPPTTVVRVCPPPPRRVVVCPPPAPAPPATVMCGPPPCCVMHPGAASAGHHLPHPAGCAVHAGLAPPSALHHDGAPSSLAPPSALHHDASPAAKPPPPAGGAAKGGEPLDPSSAPAAAADAADASPPPDDKEVVQGPSLSIPSTAPGPAAAPEPAPAEEVADGLADMTLDGGGDDASDGATAAAAAAAAALAATTAATVGSSSTSMSSLSSSTASSSSVSSSSRSSSSDSLSGLAARAAALAGVPPPPASLSPLPRYGFGRAFSGRFPPDRAPATYAAIALPYPDSVAERQRRAVRLAAEDDQFDPEHYAADYMLPGDHEDALTVPPPFGERPSLSAGERLLLSRFPQTTGVADTELHRVLAGIVCAVWAWAYDRRVSGGGGGVEAWWNLTSLSPVFSFLDDEFFDIASALDAVARRSLAYPLIRSVRMVRAVCADTAAVFQGDPLRVRERLVRVLLDVHTALLDGDGCGDVAEMFVSPYLSWVMDEGGMSPAVLDRLCNSVVRYSWHVGSVGWDLKHIEALARRVARDDPGLTGGGQGAGGGDAAAAGAAAAVLLSTAAAFEAAEGAAASASEGPRPGSLPPAGAAAAGDMLRMSDSVSLLSEGSGTCSSGRSVPTSWSSGYTDEPSVDSSGDSAFARRAQVAIEGVRRG